MNIYWDIYSRYWDIYSRYSRYSPKPLEIRLWSCASCNEAAAGWCDRHEVEGEQELE